MKKVYLIILGIKICYDLIFGFVIIFVEGGGGDEKFRLVLCFDMKIESYLWVVLCVGMFYFVCLSVISCWGCVCVCVGKVSSG